MRDYEVSIPVAGVYIATVQANSAEEAIDIAFYEADDILNPDNLEQIDIYRDILRGNVTYVPLTHAEASPVL